MTLGNVVHVTEAERLAVDRARDAFHYAVLAVLRAHAERYETDVDDVTAAGESIALEGYFEVQP